MLLAEVYLVIFILSNKSIITRFSCQLVPKKLPMRANISCVILNIHQSKLIVAKLQYTNFTKHIPILFSPPSWTIFLAKVIFLKESQLEVINGRVDAWTIHSSQNCIRKWVLIIKSPKSFQKFLLLYIILFERIVYTKTII